MAELGKAYVQIIPSAEGISGSISNVLTPEANRAGKSAGKSLSNSLGSALSGGAGKAFSAFGSGLTKLTATGAAAISGLTASITSSALSGGMSRAIGLDDATAKFKQLGMDVDGMMASVNDSVTGTRYSLDQAAGVAVSFGAAGVKAGSDMTDSLKSVASVASISGRGFDEIGAIYTKVASTGKVTGQVMQQLSMNGVNANAALQKALGKSSEEITAMVSAGQIDFKTFSNAMTAYFGDAAASANTTFSGALANTQSALSRLGASFQAPMLESFRIMMAGTSEDSVGLIGALNAVNTALQPVAEKFGQIANTVGVQLANSFNAFATTLNNTGSIMEAIKAFFAELIPDSLIQKFNELDPATQSFLGTLAKIGGVVAGAAAGWGVLTGAISSLIPGLGALLGPLAGAGGAFTLIKTLGTNLIGMFQSMIPALSGSGGAVGGLAGRLGSLAGPVGWAITAFTAMWANSEKFRSAIGNLVTSIGQSLMPIIRTVMGIVGRVMPLISELAGYLGDALAPVIRAITPILQSVLARVNSVIKTVASFALPILKVAVKIIGTVAVALGNMVGKALNIVGKIRGAFNKIKDAITKPITKAKEVVTGIIDKIKAVFPFNLGKILNLKVPHIKIKGGKAPWGIGGAGKKPSIDVEWKRKAESQPYMFTDATLFGAGEHNDEMLYGRAALMRDIREATGGGATQNITINVDGAENPEEFAVRLAKRLKMEMRTA